MGLPSDFSAKLDIRKNEIDNRKQEKNVIKEKENFHFRIAVTAILCSPSRHSMAKD